MSTLVEPHGGVLVDRIVRGAEAAALADRVRSRPRLTLDARERADLELIATGAASPLTGFLGAADYDSILRRLRLADGTVWPLPLTLAVNDEARARLVKGLYRRALAGEVPHFTGVSDPYEPPPQPDVAVRSDQETVEESLDKILDALAERRLLRVGACEAVAS